MVYFTAEIGVLRIIKGDLDEEFISVEAPYEIREPIYDSLYDYIMKKKYGKKVEVHIPPCKMIDEAPSMELK